MERNISRELRAFQHLLHHAVDFVDVVAASREMRVQTALHDKRLECAERCQLLARVFLDDGVEIYRLVFDDGVDRGVRNFAANSTLIELLSNATLRTPGPEELPSSELGSIPCIVENSIRGEAVDCFIRIRRRITFLDDFPPKIARSVLASREEI